MKFFIDFEAQQFSNDILSVGCISENDDTFYSLVYPVKRKKINSFIQELTGLTQEELDNAPTSDEVFSKFWDWCNERNDGKIEFYCYGNCDKDFVNKNYKYSKDLKAKSILGILLLNLINYTSKVKVHFGVKNEIGLIKVYNYYKKEENNQRHNALEDAIMLKYIYEQVESHENEFGVFVPKEQKPQINKNSHYHVIATKENNEKIEFDSLGAAASWVAANNNLNNKNSIHTIKRKIKNKAKDKKPYNNCIWELKEKNETEEK